MKGRLEQALRFADQAVAARPDSWEGYGLRSTIEFELGHLADSERDTQRIVEIAPRMSQGHSSLGSAYFLQGRFLEAKQAFAEAVSKHMITSLKTVTPDTSLDVLLKLFEEGLTPIGCDDHKFYGLITPIDLVSFLRNHTA